MAARVGAEKLEVKLEIIPKCLIHMGNMKIVGVLTN
jgi:hypothetical protein